jgi:hypothetical protein
LVNTPNEDAFRHAENFDGEWVRYAFVPQQLSFGKICSIAAGWHYVAAVADHFNRRRSVLPGTVFPDEWRSQTAAQWCAGPCP